MIFDLSINVSTSSDEAGVGIDFIEGIVSVTVSSKHSVDYVRSIAVIIYHGESKVSKH